MRKLTEIPSRHLGGSRPYRTHFLEIEKDFLLDEHIRFENQRRQAGLVIDYSAMRWGEIAERFNQTFAGKTVPGSSTPRPARTKVALRTERSRVKRITDHTGIAPKDQKTVQTQPSSNAKVIEDKSEEDKESEKDGPSGTRQGDPPPGQPPRKDDDNPPGGGAIHAGQLNAMVGA